MPESVMYKVLWVDDMNFDESGEVTSFYDGWQLIADRYNIQLVPFSNWEDAELELQRAFDDFCAVILDANCKIHRNDIEPEEFILAALPRLTSIFGVKNKYIPWYILSEGTMGSYSNTIKGASFSHLPHEEEWGRLDYIKSASPGDERHYDVLFKNILNVAQRQSNNVVLFRHKDVFSYLGKDRLISNQARQLMLQMLRVMYFPEDNANFTFTGNPLRKVMEYIFRAAYKVNLLPKECFERDDQINLLESNRFMSGLNTRYSNLRYGTAGDGKDGKGGDTIFPEYMGHITKAIISFGSADSHTNEDFPYTINDKDLSLTENEKELFFSYVLQLCHIIKFFGNFSDEHPDHDKTTLGKRMAAPVFGSGFS